MQWRPGTCLLLYFLERLLKVMQKTLLISFFPVFQEGFAPPEDEDLDEQAHLDQDEY